VVTVCSNCVPGARGTKSVPSVPGTVSRGLARRAAAHQYAGAVTRREWLAATAGVTAALSAAVRHPALAAPQTPAPDDPTTLSIAELADA